MRLARVIVLSMLVLFAASVFGQNTLTVSGTAIVDNNGNLANGTVYLVPDRQFGFVTDVYACCQKDIVRSATVTNGAFTLANFPKQSRIKPADVCWTLTIVDSSNHVVFGPDGYRCVKPDGASWSLDAHLATLPVGITNATLIKPFTVATLPTNPAVNTVVRVTDWNGSGATVTTGGGSTKTLAVWNGTVWEVTGGTPAVAALADPGGNGIVKRTALNTTTTASAGTDYVAPSTTVNGHALNGNVTVSAADAGALPDLGSNGIVYRNAPSTTALAVYTNIVNLWASGACTGFLFADGTCVAATKSGANVTFPGTVAGTSFITASANPAASGTLRLAYTDSIVFRNSTNTGDLPVTVDSGNVIHFPYGIQNDNPTNDLGVYPGGSVPVAPSAGSWHPFFDTTAGFSVRSNSAIKTLPNAYTSTAGKVIDTYNSTTGAITEKGTALSCLVLGATTSTTYAQATTYYNGRIGAASTTNSTPTALTVPRTGVIKSVCYGNYIGGTIDSGTNTGTFQLYKLNTTTALTDTAITPNLHTVFLPTAGSCVSGTLDTVTAGDTLLLQVITPTTMGASATSVVTNATVCYDAT